MSHYKQQRAERILQPWSSEASHVATPRKSFGMAALVAMEPRYCTWMVLSKVCRYRYILCRRRVETTITHARIVTHAQIVTHVLRLFQKIITPGYYSQKYGMYVCMYVRSSSSTAAYVRMDGFMYVCMYVCIIHIYYLLNGFTIHMSIKLLSETSYSIAL